MLFDLHSQSHFSKIDIEQVTFMECVPMATKEPIANPIRLKQIALSTKDLFMMRPQDIVVMDDFNVRDFSLPENIAHVRALADNIKAYGGVRIPLMVKWEDKLAKLVSGECRLRASLLAISEGFPLEAIPCMSEPIGQDEIARSLSFFSDNTGKNLNALEQSVGVARAHKLGLSPAQIAERIGFTHTWVSELLTLAGAPEAVKAKIREGAISPTSAAEIVRKDGSEAADVIAEASSIALASGKGRTTPKHVKAARDARAERTGSAPASTVKGAEKVTRIHSERIDANVLKRALTEIVYSTTDEKTKAIAQKALAEFSGETATGIPAANALGSMDLVNVTAGSAAAL